MRAHAAPVDSVLLIGFGGPTRSEDVMPFLRRVVQGRGVPDSRLAVVARHYDAVGGRSPYNDLTRAQALALQEWLKSAGRPLPVFVGMRNWDPLLADAVLAMNRAGHRHAAGVILAAHRSQTSWERYMEDVERALAGTGVNLAVSYL